MRPDAVAAHAATVDHWAQFHVHMDGEPDVVGHICQALRDVGLTLPCPEGDIGATDGNCSHVQIKPCDCSSLVKCDGHTPAETLDVSIQLELAAGNWPNCPTCGQHTQLGYMGLVADAPTFMCLRDSTVFAMDLKEG